MYSLSASCHSNHELFLRVASGQEPQTCVSAKTCCTSQMESTLRQRAVSELQAKVIKRLDGVKGSTSSLRQDMKGYFQDIVRNAKKESLLSLKQSNANLSRIGGPLVTTFFNQVEDSLENQDINITNIVLQFLRDSFPPLFNYATGQSKRFSNQYGKCLKDKVNNVQLFGSIPYRIATTVESVIKPMQIFLRGFTFAGKVIDSGKQLNFTKGCYPILLQMTFCSMCRGEDSSVKPCEGYCIDVLKNCLMTTVQLQKEWSMFFDAMDNLATGLSRSLIKETLNQVYADLSFAVVQVIPQIQNPKLKSNLFKECGLPSFGSGSTSPSDRTKGKSQRMKASLKEKMETAKTKMTSLRSLFKEMPRDICILDRVSALRTEKVIVANCWNGTAVGR
ncbi:hypothetical protein QZH41_009584 [Actinostola sp. cb2023]|nr:hypothetical protein QZH41_009584 [Actinostola sp. cb2023]